MRFQTDLGPKLPLTFSNGTKNMHYLVLVDYYSDWIEFDLMKNQTAAEIIDLMQKQFVRWGIPNEIVTDSGTNYGSAEFSQFCQRKKIKHTKSSPNHHQSNGKPESAVKIAKSLLRKSQTSALNPHEALLDQCKHTHSWHDNIS